MSDENTSTGSTTSNPTADGQGTGAAPSGAAQSDQDAVVDMPSYEGDVAAMRAHTNFLDTVMLPHFEALIASAQAQGMGANLTGALAQGLEQAQGARHSVARATDATVRLNQAVADAYVDAADAAKNKTYYQGE